MKSKQKSLMLKIIIMFIVILIMDTFVPFYTSNAKSALQSIYTALGDDAEDWFWARFFNAFTKFLADIADIVIKWLQHFFIGNGTINISDKYYIRYSPGIIFSGTIPAFDVNFISPMDDFVVENLRYQTLPQESTFDDLVSNSIPIILGHFGYTSVDSEINNIIETICNEIDWSTTSTKTYIIEGIEYERYIQKNYGIDFYLAEDAYEDDYQSIAIVWDVQADEQSQISAVNSFRQQLRNYFGNGDNEEDYNVKANELESLLRGKEKVFRDLEKKYQDFLKNDSEDDSEIESTWDYFEVSVPCVINEKNVILDIGYDCDQQKPYRIAYAVYEQTGEVIESSASILQKIVATWYNVMKTIALVGLLSVLVYVAIRMIISSSLEDKAKYKKMLGDWLAALCLLYLLHYFMGLVLAILEAISDIFQASIIGQFGEDILMTSIRNTIERGNGFFEQFANIIVYLVLVILTVMFTYQYLKRFIYAAFLTMIAPLIALTYPLDKIKDGQAQAYTTWLREYVFTVLIQAVHLIVYYILLGSTADLLDGSNQEVYNPIFAIAAISFILPAEKFIRSMFGFDKAEASNTLGSALGGAALMQAINGLGKNSPKGAKESGGEKGEDDSKVRTANPEKDPYDALKGGNGEGKPGGGPENGVEQNQAQKRSIKKGLGNVAKKYVLNKNTAKNILKGGAKIAGAATLGTIGLAAGIATGEPEKALAGAVGGIAAGGRVGSNLVDGGANLIDGVSGGIRGIGDTYKEGKYGKDEYARMKFDKEFKKTPEYKEFINNHKGRENDVQEFLNAGITDLKMMNKAFEKNYNIQEAIGFMKMAQASDCPNEVLYDKEKFKTYLASRGIPETEAERIRKGIVTFK